MKRTILLTLIFYPALLLSQQLLTPEEAVKIALENNYSIRIARNNLDIAENNYSVGNAGFLPNLTADSYFNRSESSTNQEFFDGGVVDRRNAGSENLNAAITLNWVIFDGLKMFASLNRFKELKKAGELDLKNELETRISDIYAAYYSIVREQKILKLIEYNITLSEERLRIEKDKKELGSSSGFDLRRAEVDLNEDKASYLREELRLIQSKILLSNILGVDSEFDFVVTDSIPLNETYSYDELLEYTGKSNSSIQLADLRKNVADLETDIARSDLFPELSLMGGYNFLRSESDAGLTKSNQTKGYVYGLRATWNLFNGFNTRRETQNAIILRENSEINFEQTQKFVTSDLRNSFKTFENSIQQMNLEMQNLKSAEENVDIALERLKLGNISPLEFREAQIDLLDAQNRLVSAQVDAKLAETELLRISGQIIRN